MTQIFNVADLCPPGSTKTYRELNREKTHKIPLNTVVSVARRADEDGEEEVELRLFVTMHGRDCDQTPLYYLSHMRHEEYERECEMLKSLGLGIFCPKLAGGYVEESLTVTHPKQS